MNIHSSSTRSDNGVYPNAVQTAKDRKPADRNRAMQTLGASAHGSNARFRDRVPRSATWHHRSRCFLAVRAKQEQQTWQHQPLDVKSVMLKAGNKEVRMGCMA